VRRFRLGFLVLALLIFTFSFAERASANWYVGNHRSGGYGAKANIWTPDDPIYVDDQPKSGISNWVSTPGPFWIQTGWRYYKNYVSPRSYAEYCIPPCSLPEHHSIDEYGTQGWGAIWEYKIDFISGTTWCSYINSTQIDCVSIFSAPAEMQALSEVHVSAYNTLNTRFSAVYYKLSSGAWFLFDQENWDEDLPYRVQKDLPYYYRNIGGRNAYIPLIIHANMVGR
jgi:hypothetical protein